MSLLTDSRWFDPAAHPLGVDAQRALGLRFDLDEDVWPALARFGTWWVRPFARTSTDQIVGLRIVPGLPPSRSPVVCLHEHEVETWATSPAQLVPRALFPGTTLDPLYWDQRRDLSDAAWSELESLHAALGGLDALAGIKGVLHDATLRSTFVHALRDRTSIASAWPEAHRRVDSAPEKARLVDYLHAAVERLEAPVPPPDLGSWSAAAAAVAFVVHQPEPGDPATMEALSAAWAVSAQPPALDSFQANHPTLHPRPVGRSHGRLSLAVATTLRAHRARLPAEWTSHPRWLAIDGLGAQGSAYRGDAHLDTAEALRSSGDAHGAFTALGAAAYWRAARAGEACPLALARALDLSEASGWSEVTAALRTVVDAQGR